MRIGSSMINFNTAECGEKVWSIVHGEGIVCAVDDSGINVRYAVNCASLVLSYTFDGKCKDDYSMHNRTLFWEAPVYTVPKRPVYVPPKDTLVVVWDSNADNKLVRYSTGETDTSGRILVYKYGASSVTVACKPDRVFYSNWKLYE